jgi:uncharacterized lipoprotein YddW (UPF0748 family)
MLPHVRIPRLGLALSLAGLLLLSPVAHPQAAVEIRALWVVRTSLTSSASIAALVDSARAGGFNTLLVQVRGRGDAYFVDGIEPRADALRRQPAAFDPLAETIARAHDAGLAVHAWMNVNLVASAVMVPDDPAHLVHRHPEWLMVPRALAAELGRVPPGDPRYLRRLASYLADRTEEVEGLYASPLVPGMAEYTISVYRDLVARYAVDGIHLDYVRYPSAQFDFSREALAAFRASLTGAIDQTTLERYDRLAVRDPLVFTDTFADRWSAFREEQLTWLVAGIRDAVREVRPSLLMTAAVVPSPDEARRRFQDWAGWIRLGLLDVVCPMAYTTDARQFVSQIQGVVDVAGRERVWAGIGAYRLDHAGIVANVAAARRLDTAGVVLFSYDSLNETDQGGRYVASVGRAAFLE